MALTTKPPTIIILLILCCNNGVFAEDHGMCKSMVETRGYARQEHTVTTEDGYVLSMQRMPMARSGKAADKPPVLQLHGLMVDGASWMLNSPNESLAFILADNGFDVWIANTRGTRYSRMHISLSTNDQAYWEWSWDELAAYDLPAFVNYVFDQTHNKMHYVGHSLGTLTPLAAFSEEKLVNMLRSAALLSPIAYLGEMGSILARSAANIFLAEQLYWAGLREFIPNGRAVSKLLADICDQPGLDCSSFASIMNSFTGRNCCVDPSIIDVYFKHALQSTSTKNMIHIAQMVRKNSFATYDYGNERDNTIHYGQPNAPVYDMTHIPNDFPLFFGYGGQDLLSDVKDVHNLLRKLEDHDPNKLEMLYLQDYSHEDFVFGVNANELVYNSIFNFFQKN